MKSKVRPIGAVVAAAGRSSRMGEYKPLLPFDGSTVIRRCIANLRSAGAEEIVVVTGYRGDELAAHLAECGVVTVHNPRYAETEMFDSLCLGLRALRRDCRTILLTPGDVPLVAPETVKALLEAEAGFACPVCAGRRGHPVALDAAYRGALLAYGGEGGPRGAAGHPHGAGGGQGRRDASGPGHPGGLPDGPFAAGAAKRYRIKRSERGSPLFFLFQLFQSLGPVPFPARTMMSCAVMLTASSAGVSAPMSSPMGDTTLSNSASS